MSVGALVVLADGTHALLCTAHSVLGLLHDCVHICNNPSTLCLAIYSTAHSVLGLLHDCTHLQQSKHTVCIAMHSTANSVLGLLHDCVHICILYACKLRLHFTTHPAVHAKKTTPHCRTDLECMHPTCTQTFEKEENAFV